jgi:hypothetical protein
VAVGVGDQGQAALGHHQGTRTLSFAACFSAPLSLTFSHDQLRAHYFEKGNVQMQTTKTLPPTSLPPTDDETTATVAVVDAIQQAEATVQVSVL